MNADPLRCPDPLAERRFAYAQAALDDGDLTAAADLFSQTLERVPLWAPAWAALGEARARLGDARGAADAFAEALRCDPQDRQGAGPQLAQLTGAVANALPPAYIARLFDDYAPRFEQHLTEALGYCGPELLASAVEAAAPGRRFARALDLGCGSGLAGRAIRARVDRLAGVDLSANMIALARKSAVYDALLTADLSSALAEEPPGGLDLILAADTLVYVGDLAPLFRLAARALAPGGLFAFTLERGEAGFELGPAMRFRHAPEHVRDAACESGLALDRLDPVTTRREQGRDAAGLLGIAHRMGGVHAGLRADSA